MILSTLENGKVITTVCPAPNFELSCNVLCVGAGSAGVNVADSARREGASVILLELNENLGGMHVCGGVIGYYYGARGGTWETDDKISEQDSVFLYNKHQYEQRQIRLVERLTKHGVKYLCKTSVIGLYFEENKVIGALVFDGEKEFSIKADITVDATSDGHLINMTNINKRYGTHNKCDFVPFGVFVQYTKDDKLCIKNNDSGIVNHYSMVDYSKKVIMAHANLGSEYASEEFLSYAISAGIREGLTFEGEDCLSCEKVLLDNPPEKTLFWAYSDLDKHGNQRATENEIFQNWWVLSNLATVMISIPVPMGSVVPKNVKGLVSAGRCMSTDAYVQSAVRMNRDMFRMGECIGIATAMASLSGVDFLDIDYQDYLSRVQKRNCFKSELRGRFGFDNPYGSYLRKMKALGKTPDSKYQNLELSDFIYEPIEFDIDKTFHLLKTDAPGVAIWSCYLNAKDKSLRDKIYLELVNATDNLYKYNCAIALGAMNDERCLPVLREIVINRDCFFFTDNRRSNQFRTAVALCLLGRLGGEEDLPMLFEMLSPSEFEREMYHTLEADYLYHTFPDRNVVYFMILTHLLVSIYKIYKRLGLDMDYLHNFFTEYFKDGSVLKRVTDAKQGEPAYEEMQEVIEYILK